MQANTSNRMYCIVSMADNKTNETALSVKLKKKTQISIIEKFSE